MDKTAKPKFSPRQSKRMHRGLWSRLTAGGVDDQVAMEIACACYPNAKKERLPLEAPVVSIEEVWGHTEDFIDNRTITLDQLFQLVWGKSIAEYYAFMSS